MSPGPPRPPSAGALVRPRPVVLNRRAAVRETITGVERYTDELTRRLLVSGEGGIRYVALAPRARAR